MQILPGNRADDKVVAILDQVILSKQKSVVMYSMQPMDDDFDKEFHQEIFTLANPGLELLELEVHQSRLGFSNPNFDRAYMMMALDD